MLKNAVSQRISSFTKILFKKVVREIVHSLREKYDGNYMTLNKGLFEFSPFLNSVL